ncbi:ArsR/SmtB family transcription factor [Parasphingopyxis marina]|uniref:Winged helix-turn-helix transcriptional regulator n=1 Tax=Parasphingopyxis marina TaxID=2761622 RepID=A0A842HWQ1_9SPHN|nr:metalloregulator ArsR/SmtB family transcription factor [Parasphingopyxis marina]MBC2776827.1 winged helix-turn-helix transcriptional regulator [Parasphingopyxis marina]
MDRFAALGDPTRRAIVARLAAADSRAGDIAAGFAISAPAISQHLKTLRQAGLVRVEKRGRERIYSLDPEGLAAMERWVSETRTLWNGRLDRLSRLLEGDE